ncbi:MAG: hypothetical protein JWO41_863 [Candidatus Saccharibacteria bacterium]|nr:hypothetical protein [Candidatus Saccharibacteria bacterium]
MTAVPQEAFGDKYPTLQEQFGGPLTEELLVESLRKLAFRNGDFRDELAREVQFVLATSDVAESEVVRVDQAGIPYTDVDKLNAATIKTEYEFGATRHYEITNFDSVRAALKRDKESKFPSTWQPVVRYILSASVTYHGASLPDTLAVELFAYNQETEDQAAAAVLAHGGSFEDAFEPDDELERFTPSQAVAYAAKLRWTAIHKTEFMIAQFEEDLTVHEKFIWLDAAGDEVRAYCTCNELNCKLSTHIIDPEMIEEDERVEVDESETELEDDEIEVGELMLEPIKLRFGEAYVIRPNHDTIAGPLTDADHALSIWSLPIVNQPLPKQRRKELDKDVRKAFNMLRAIDQLLKEQAGVETNYGVLQERTRPLTVVQTEARRSSNFLSPVHFWHHLLRRRSSARS